MIKTAKAGAPSPLSKTRGMSLHSTGTLTRLPPSIAVMRCCLEGGRVSLWAEARCASTLPHMLESLIPPPSPWLASKWSGWRQEHFLRKVLANWN